VNEQPTRVPLRASSRFKYLCILCFRLNKILYVEMGKNTILLSENGVVSWDSIPPLRILFQRAIGCEGCFDTRPSAASLRKTWMIYTHCCLKSSYVRYIFRGCRIFLVLLESWYTAGPSFLQEPHVHELQMSRANFNF
jgi:hypothetical protein